MAHDANPLTGNLNTSAIELPSGDLVMFDMDDGLLFGDGELPAGVKADAMFESRFRMPRPEGYKATLEEVAATDTPGRIPDVHVESARGVLAGTSQVFVTSAKVRDMAREIGLAPTASNAGAVRISADKINVNDLGTGAATNRTAQVADGGNTALRAKGEAESARARARVDGKPEPVASGSSDTSGTEPGAAEDNTVALPGLASGSSDVIATA